MTLAGHQGALEHANGHLYMALGLRNGGTGLAVLHGWHAEALVRERQRERPDPDRFRRQQLDLYIPAGDTGFWQGAIRDPQDPYHEGIRSALSSGSRVQIDILYGDYEGGQRTVARFGIGPDAETGETRSQTIHYWNLDRVDPR